MKLLAYDIQILQIIIKHCKEIEDTVRLFGADRRSFDENHIYRNACSMALQSIGEAAKGLSDGFLEDETRIPWRAVKGIRTMFAHIYDQASFDWNIVWNTIVEDVPLMREVCTEALAKENVSVEHFSHYRWNEREVT